MKISIITITYNSEKTIETTILSVIKQKFSNLEYIIIDGGSTDSTLKIINKYKKYISIVISEPDKGISDAFNKGIGYATGDIIGIINSDDFLNKDSLNKINKFVNENPNNDIYYGNVINFDDKHNYIYKPTNNIEDIKKYMFIPHPSTFIKKDAYQKYGLYDLNYKYAMDYDLLSRMYNQGAKFFYIDTNIAWFRLGGVSRKKINDSMNESIKISVRNGRNLKESQKWYKKIIYKERLINILRIFNLESFLRKTLKKQQSDTANYSWYK